MSHIVSYQCKYVRSLKIQQIAQEDFIASLRRCLGEKLTKGAVQSFMQ